MADEHEYKFLIKSIPEAHLQSPERICQGYLGHHPQSTTRVRTKGNQAFITVKGSRTGISRTEFEYEIPLADAEAMLYSMIPVSKQISKTRYTHVYKNQAFIIDVFDDSNSGLILAELEVKSPDTPYEIPEEWDCVDVTTNNEFYNSQLAEKPVSQWTNKPNGAII